MGINRPLIPMNQKIIALVLIFSFLFCQSHNAFAEALGEQFSSVTPNRTGGGGEFMHGQNQGKLLMRTLILGAVPQQGIHYVPEGTDVLFAVLYAGGYTDASRLNGISVRRRNVRDLIDVPLEDLIADGSEIPRLMDGDIVTVPYNWRRDIATISMITGFLSSMTAFTLSIVALAK